MKTLRIRRAAWLLCFALLLALTLALCVLPVGAEDCEHSEGYDNGFCIGCDAAQEAPLKEGVYEISNAGQLYWFAAQLRAKQPTAMMKAKLTCNITVNATLLNAQGELRSGSKRAWVPLGDAETVMTGVELDGQGYYISGLYASYDDGRDVGLFGKASHITVKNLGIIDSYFYSDSGFVGGIVANAVDGAQIDHCYVNATLKSATGGIGGIAGALEKDTEACTVSYCYTTYESLAYGADSETVFSKCFYRADSETDTFEGTAYYTADGKLADDTTLAEGLAADSTPWVISCRTGKLALLIDHVYAYVCTPECVVCNDTNRADQAAHEYDNACDRSCNVCARINPDPVEHVGFTSCGTVCRYCGVTIIAKTAHQYSNECDSTCDCGFERSVVPHLYDGACDADCNLCKATRSLTELAEHTYDNSCDRVCNVCNVTRPITHTYDNVCDAECNVCGAKRTAAHVYGEYVVTKEAGALSNGEQERTCTLCGHKDVRVIARYGFPLWATILIGVGTGLALCGGGFALYWFVFRKRAKKKGAKENKKK